MSKPEINVTPLIDVLLVLLIIFMVISPLKPASFEARIPPEQTAVPPARDHPLSLAVIIESDRSLRLNGETGLGTIDDPEPLVSRLAAIFDERIKHSVQPENSSAASGDTERTVFIRAGRSMDYGSVARVVDAVKISGAKPIGLQIDGLEN